MDDFLNKLLDKTGDFIAARPGCLPLLGLGLIVINLILQFYPGVGIWIVDRHLFLHAGLIVALLGLLLIRPLG